MLLRSRSWTRRGQFGGGGDAELAGPLSTAHVRLGAVFRDPNDGSVAVNVGKFHRVLPAVCVAQRLVDKPGVRYPACGSRPGEWGWQQHQAVPCMHDGQHDRHRRGHKYNSVAIGREGGGGGGSDHARQEIDPPQRCSDHQLPPPTPPQPPPPPRTHAHQTSADECRR